VILISAAVGKVSVETLINRIKNRKKKPYQVRLPVEIIERESTRAK
jgi:DNA-binding LacI/PurR family transcriptional regulator